MNIIAVWWQMTKKYKNSVKEIHLSKKIKTNYNPEDSLLYNSKPSWNFKYCDMYSEKYRCYNIIDSSLQNIKNLFLKLQEFEGMTWGGIIQNRTNNHFISLEDFKPLVRERVSELRFDEDELFSIRLGGRIRLYGVFRDNSVFCILFFDTEHELCPSLKKHT